jgi:hypothetical protein
MQRVGDVCSSCVDHHTNNGVEPQVLQKIGTTTNKKMIAVACSYCDGDAVKIYKLNEVSK